MFGQEESGTFVNVSVKNGSFTSQGLPLLKYLLTEDLITKDQYSKLEGKKLPLEFTLKDVVETEYEESRKVRFRGTANLNDKPVFITLSLGKETVACRYLLTGLLLRANPFQKISLMPQATSTAKGNTVTKIWVNQPEEKDGIPVGEQPQDTQEKLELLSKMFPGKVKLM